MTDTAPHAAEGGKQRNHDHKGHDKDKDKAKDKDGEKPQGAGMTKAMMYVMPLISVFFCYQYNATFAFYWTFSNLVSLGVTVVLNHTMFKKKPDNGEVMKKL